MGCWCCWLGRAGGRRGGEMGGFLCQRKRWRAFGLWSLECHTRVGPDSSTAPTAPSGRTASRTAFQAARRATLRKCPCARAPRFGQVVVFHRWLVGPEKESALTTCCLCHFERHLTLPVKRVVTAIESPRTELTHSHRSEWLSVNTGPSLNCREVCRTFSTRVCTGVARPIPALLRPDNSCCCSRKVKKLKEGRDCAPVNYTGSY